MKTNLGLGKYRDLLIAILLFIVLDLGILLFNFYASWQLERDAARINSAGELRMLTQQITKALLTLQVERKADLPIQTSMAQLSQGQIGFNASLQTLRDSLGSDIEFKLFGLDPAVLRDSVRKVEREWGPLDESIKPVVAEITPALEDVEIAANKAVARNIRLAGMSDDVAAGVEASARAKTQRMRVIQAAAIVLALLNFVYIVFKFLRRLSASDRVAEAARRETEDILNTVSEGLLLVRPDGTVGNQCSASVAGLFMRPLTPGEDFQALLADMLDPARAEEAASYLQLLFDPKVKPALLTQLDPLRDVEVRAPGPEPRARRHLTFQFTQVRENGRVKELLVTVFDVSERVRLERELAATQEAARGGVDDLIRVLEQEPALLQDFLLGARDKLANLNDQMRDAGRRPRDYQRLVDEAAQMIHGIKGEAAALSLSAIARQAHRMEDVLAPLRGNRGLAGEDLIPVVVELSKVQEQVERLHKVFVRIDHSDDVDRPPLARPTPLAGMIRNLESLSVRVAESMSKQVRLTAAVQDEALPPHVAQVLRETLPQLVRNAVVHGIESPQERLSRGKPAVGELRLEVRRQSDGGIEVVLSDDGRGISVGQVRERATRLSGEAARMSDSQILGFIFDPAFSTATEVTEHAGRGDGLALVRQLVERAGARLRVMTQPSAYTRFILQFQPA